jgi:ribosomal subunit interface protein
VEAYLGMARAACDQPQQFRCKFGAWGAAKLVRTDYGYKLRTAEAAGKVNIQMVLRIAGKHMDIGDAFRTRINDRIGEAIEKYFDRGFSGQVTVIKAGSRYTADCMIRLDSGASLQAAGEAQDPTQAFDAAAERLEKRLRRYNRRLKSHYPNNNTVSPAVDIAYAVMAPLADDDEEMPEDFAPAIVAESTMPLRTMSVASAVIELDTTDSPVFVFRNAGNEHLNIVYRRPDGNVGWIDPSTIKLGQG